MIKNKNLFIIFLIIFFETMCRTVIFRLLPLYLEKMGFEPTMIGVLTASVAACEIVAIPILGKLSDAWGRRRILIFSQIGTVLSILLMIWADAPHLIFVALILDGLTSGNYPITDAYVSDFTKPEERMEAFRTVSMIFYLGLILGPLTASLIAIADFRYSFAAGALFSFGTVLLSYFYLPKDADASEHAEGEGKKKLDWGVYGRLLKTPALIPYFLQFLLFNIAYTLYYTGLTLFLEHRFSHDGHTFGIKEASYIFGAIGIYTLVLQGFVLKKIQKKWGEVTFIHLGFISAIIGYFFLGIIRQPELLYVVLIFTVFGNSIIPQTLTAQVSKNSSNKEQGTVMGMMSAIGSSCRVVMPMIAGFLIERELLTTWAWIPSVIFALALFVSLRQNRKPVSPEAAS